MDTQMITSRRSFLVGLGALIAAPAIVRASVIMPVKPMLILPEAKVITDLTFPIEGFARVAGWQTEWATVRANPDGWKLPDYDPRLRPANEKLAEFGGKGWEFTEHELNGEYRPSRAVVTLRDGTVCQRKGRILS
jgi:hypothetical protein